MESPTDQIIRATYSTLHQYYEEAGSDEIVETLASEVGKAAYELVNPVHWVARALTSAKVSSNRSEAHAKVSSIINQNARNNISLLNGSRRLEYHHAQNIKDINKSIAIREMTQNIGYIALPIHARLESCSLDELDQAAVTVIEIAKEIGNPKVTENVILCLVIFSDNYKDVLSRNLRA